MSDTFIRDTGLPAPFEYKRYYAQTRPVTLLAVSTSRASSSHETTSAKLDKRPCASL